MKHRNSHQTVAQQPQGRPYFLAPARSDAIFDGMSEEIARRMACGEQK